MKYIFISYVHLFTIAGLLRGCIHHLPASKTNWEVWSGHEALIPAVIVPDNDIILKHWLNQTL